MELNIQDPSDFVVSSVLTRVLPDDISCRRSELKKIFQESHQTSRTSCWLNIYGVRKLFPEKVTNMAARNDFDLATTHPHLESEPEFRYFVV